MGINIAMRYFLNDVEMSYGPFVLNGIRYPENVLTLWSNAELAELGIRREASVRSVENICDLIDLERNRRLAFDFPYDFGETTASDDHGNTFAAGVRNLQMKPEDRSNWQTLQGAALTAVLSGQPNMVLPMRAEDNCNIQTSAIQILGVLSEMTQFGSSILFYGGRLKEQVRASQNPESINIFDGWPERSVEV